MFNKLRKIQKIRLLFFVIADIVLISLSIYLAFYLRFDGEIPSEYFRGLLPATIVFALVFCLPIFYFLGLYSFSWSYVSTQELISLIKGVTAGFVLLSALLFLLKSHPIFRGFPRSTVVISYLLVFIFAGALRFAKRVYFELFKNKSGALQKKRTLIVGAGDAGESILRSILSSRESIYLPVGFVDDNKAKQGIEIHGVKILGTIEDIPEITTSQEVDQLIIALPSAGSGAIKRAVQAGRKAGIKDIKIVPPISEIIDGKISTRNLREIKVEDLLNRPPFSLDTKAIRDFISGKVVLIAGAAGSIGSELSRQVAKFSPSLLLLLDCNETGLFNISKELSSSFFHLRIKELLANIQDKPKIEKIFKKYRPDLVFHAAAYKHVSLMESHPDEAVKNNIFGTEIIAKSALKSGVKKFIFISTDKAVNPTSVMGASKRIGEAICRVLNQKGSTKFIAVRFGNVLDSRGSVVPIFKKQIEKGGPVEVTHPEMERYFMTIPEACLLVLQAGLMGEGGEVFVLNMGKPIKILDLARELIRLSGFEPDKDIPIVFTGPKPGEKFSEEILTAEEGTIATENEKIFKAKLSPVDEEKLQKGLSELREAVEKGDFSKIISIKKSLVPFYEPSEKHFQA